MSQIRRLAAQPCLRGTPQVRFGSLRISSLLGAVWLMAGSLALAQPETGASFLAYNSVLLAYNAVPSALNRASMGTATLPAEIFSNSLTPSESLTFLPSMSLSLTTDQDGSSQFEERHFSTLFRRSAPEWSVYSDGSIVLMHRRMASRHGYRSWTEVQSGYGQAFTGEDSLGRSRISGAGAVTDSVLYLKMCFAF